MKGWKKGGRGGKKGGGSEERRERKGEGRGERKRKREEEEGEGRMKWNFSTILQTTSYFELLWLMELNGCLLLVPESHQLFWFHSSTPIQGLSPMVHIATHIQVPTKHNVAVLHQMIQVVKGEKVAVRGS